MIPRDPGTQSPSRQGYSTGLWEDENTLVIHTSRINSPYLGFTGISLSEDVEVIERYMLSEDQARLDFLFTVTDRRSSQGQRRMSTTGWLWGTFELYECDVH